MSILVVDDDSGTRETISDIFEENGYLVISASTGTIAIEKAKEINEEKNLEKY